VGSRLALIQKAAEMMVLDWREMPLVGGVLREPESDESRLIVWLPAGTEGDLEYWERIGNVARGDVVVNDGLCSTPATMIRARRKTKGLLGKLLGRLGEGKGKRSFVLPGGASVEQCGERAVDCLLVWSEGSAADLDAERVRSRWPEARRHLRLGPRLFLVDGVSARAGSGNGASAAVELPPPDVNPRQQAEAILVAARQGGDRTKEVSALTDLGIITLTEGDARSAIVRFEEALALVRQLGDPVRESDIMGNLGMALLYVQQPVRARQFFEHELAYARSTGDVLVEKVAMERMGLVTSVVGNPRLAIDWFERALELARRVGDQHHEANLLWLEAIQLAELNQRDTAIAKAQESIALFAKLGKPQASWYGAYLQKYRMGLFDTWPSPTATGVTPGPGAFLGGSLVAGVVASQVPGQAQASPQQTTGPGLLRMALSATKSAAQFAGSGFKTTPPEVQRRRIQTCATCEHHTGMRCKICGCFTAAKSRLLHESCPIGKWPA
jgi:tetratricopeptide (TPR) repeat protein